MAKKNKSPQTKSKQTGIQRTDATWNPVKGCTKISAGCKFCYAEKMANRLKAMHQADPKLSPQYADGFKLALVPSALDKPKRWRKPRMIFVCSMSDLFHKDVPDDYIQKVFKIMNELPRHTFQVLTKRIERTAKMQKDGKIQFTDNIWIGTSTENNALFHKRLPHLKKIQAKVRFLSIEPLIGPVVSTHLLDGLQWVIVGGESGHPKARPMKKGWVLTIQMACAHFGIPFFFKQWGKNSNNPDRANDPTVDASHQFHAKGGCALNGKVYQSVPGKNSIHSVQNTNDVKSGSKKAK